MTDSYVLGEVPRLTAAFRVAGVLTDPTRLTLTLQKPDGTSAVIGDWPTTPGQIAHDSVGQFSALVITADQEGEYRYRFLSTGAAAGAAEGEFLVESVLTDNPAYTYDPTTAIGKIRLLTDDRDLSRVDAGLALEQRSAIFSDAELASLLADANGDVYYAAARVLITISGNRSLLVQTRRIGRTQVEFGSVRADLQRQAQTLIEMSQSEPADGLAEIDWTDFSLRRIIINEQLRTQSGG